jgi:mannose-6-phosphate isomerase-like protein (cupin superfamily)
MKLVTSQQTNRFENSPACIALEYPHHDPEMNLAVIILSGRYPETGYSLNTGFKEIAYILEGSVTCSNENEQVRLNPGDSLILERNEKYYWIGTAKILMVCTPPFNPEQHINVN